MILFNIFYISIIWLLKMCILVKMSWVYKMERCSFLCMHARNEWISHQTLQTIKLQIDTDSFLSDINLYSYKVITQYK